MHALANAWLSLQCKMISNVSQGMVILGDSLAGPLTPTANWPLGVNHNPQLSAAAVKVISVGKSVIQESASGDIIACPIVLKNEILGVVAIEADSRNSSGQQAILQMLQWGVLWLHFLLEKEQTSQKDRLIAIVELIGTSLSDKDFKKTITSLTSDLASRLSCERVSLGTYQNGKIQINAISKTARFDQKTQIIQDIESLMCEAIDQDALIIAPVSGQKAHQITAAHTSFIKRYGKKSICTVPLIDDHSITGAICFERSEQLPFTVETLELIEHIAQLIGPIVEIKRHNERHFLTRIGDSYRSFFAGQKHLRTKASLFLLMIAVLFFSVAESEFRITANATLEGISQRAIVSPIDGYIESASFSAGDTVKKDQLLAKLSDEELKLERFKTENQKQQLRKEYRTELANHDRSKIRILSSKIKQADAQINLLDAELSRTEIKSPFDGTIIIGDLSHNLGSPVEKGQVLFEITPQKNYRVILQVDETEITSIKESQKGQLVLSALPSKTLSFLVTKITPVSRAEEGKNYFRVEALLDQPAELLRPGMNGIGKVKIDERKLFWIWTHKLTDWLSLKLWSWQS